MITIAPAALARLILGQVLSLGICVVIVSCFGLLMLIVARQASSAAEMLLPGIPTATALFALGLAIVRFATVARMARLPAIMRASRSRLTIDVPTLGRRRHSEWPGSLVADVSLRHAGVVPALMRFIRVQIAFTDDRAVCVMIPSPGGESLALIEDNLRDALGLPVITA